MMDIRELNVAWTLPYMHHGNAMQLEIDEISGKEYSHFYISFEGDAPKKVVVLIYMFHVSN